MDITLLAAAFGITLFSSAIVAPGIFSRLDEAAASRLLRAFWPRYYLVNALLALAAAYFAEFEYVALLAVSVAVMMVVSLIATPMLNRARDQGRHRAFSIGHGAVVAVNLVAIVTLGWAIFMALAHQPKGAHQKTGIFFGAESVAWPPLSVTRDCYLSSAFRQDPGCVQAGQQDHWPQKGTDPDPKRSGAG